MGGGRVKGEKEACEGRSWGLWRCGGEGAAETASGQDDSAQTDQALQCQGASQHLRGGSLSSHTFSMMHSGSAPCAHEVRMRYKHDACMICTS